MVVLGKTRMVELAYGGWGTNAVQGTPWNPWDPDTHRVPGGSSSGTGVAVAAGMAPVGIGTDTGGSVRIPAAMCGLVGLKTTTGRIPTDHVVPLSRTLDTVGPMTRDVRDAALLFDALTRSDAADDVDAGVPPGLRLGVLTAADLVDVEPEILSAYREAIAVLRRSGADCREFSMGSQFGEFVDKNGLFIACEGWREHGARIAAAGDLMDPHVRCRFEVGREIDGARYRAAQAERAADQRRMLAAMQDIDVIATPTTPISAIPVTQVEQSQLPLNRFTRAVNYLDLCALAVPAGLSSSGLPLSVQFIARRDGEAMLLRLGRAYESVRGRLPEPDLAKFGWV